MMQGAGVGSPFGGGMGGGFPAPGNPGGAPNPTIPAIGAAPQSPGQDVSNLVSPLGGAGAGAVPQFDPAAMQQMLGMLGGGGIGAGANAFGGGFGGAPAAPADTRPPEERFQVQLQVRLSPIPLRADCTERFKPTAIE